MANHGTKIYASEFVAIQDKAQSLLGTGSITRGYGQTVWSSDVFNGNSITKAQWDALRYDITTIRYHQDGVLPDIVTVNANSVIGYGAGSPNTNYDTLLETALANRFQLATSQSVASAITTATTTTAWSASAVCTITCTFANSNQARYFFNSGGKIRITPSLSGGSGTAQQNAWINILNAVGTQSFGAAGDSTVTYYSLTNSYQTYYVRSMSTPYSSNSYKLEAKTDVADNSTGTATVLYLKVTLNDAYIDPDTLTGNVEPPGDSVNGTLILSFNELKASGSAYPSGTFSITSPSYSVSSISVS